MSDPARARKLTKSGKQKASGSSSHQPMSSGLPSLATLHTTPSSSILPPSQSRLTSPQSQTAPKVAIPRLRRDSDDLSASASALADKNRVAHACEPCRHKKTKCSGDKPTCKHCKDFELVCVYADGKRDKTKKQMGSMAGKLDEYETLLRELSLVVDQYQQARIQEVLDRETSPVDDDAAYTSPQFGSPSRVSSPHGEDDVPASVGSTESVDKIHEDFNSPTARATGYHGKNSELTWIQRLKRRTSNGLDESDGEEQPDGSDEHMAQNTLSSSETVPISDSTYHCDDLPIILTEQVDPFDIPPQHIADALFHTYLDSIHPVFPIIGKKIFTEQYQMFITNRAPSNHWVAILNMIFAIGARYSHLIQTEWRGQPMDHLVYFTRARMLGFDTDSVLGHAELQRVQVTGLMAFYLMSTSQINRSWAMNGVAVRQAIAMGLHLRNDAKDISDSSKEIRYRVWWALSSLERELAVMNGRPPSFLEADCTAPWPLPLEEDKLDELLFVQPQTVQSIRHWQSQEARPNEYEATPTSIHSQRKPARVSPYSPSSPTGIDPGPNVATSDSLYFFHRMKLSIISSEVLSQLYRAVAMVKSWSHTQATMCELTMKLEKWRNELPAVFDFSKPQHDQRWLCQRTSLGFSYHSTMIIINRPSLCRIDRQIPNESGKARDINQSTASKCVHAASDMLKLLPDKPDPTWFYKVSPWWCLVHHFMQASTILMLELSFRADHMPTEVDDIFESANKVLAWLRSMSPENVTAERASRMCDDMLRKVAPRVGRSGDDVPRPGFSEDGMMYFRDMQATDVAHPHLHTNSTPSHSQMLSSYDQLWPTPSTTLDSIDDIFPSSDRMFPDGTPPSDPLNDRQGWY